MFPRPLERLDRILGVAVGPAGQLLRHCTTACGTCVRCIPGRRTRRRGIGLHTGDGSVLISVLHISLAIVSVLVVLSRTTLLDFALAFLGLVERALTRVVQGALAGVLTLAAFDRRLILLSEL